MKTYGGVEVKFYTLLTVDMRWEVSQYHALAGLPSGKIVPEHVGYAAV
jgi:hypothetical protein